jgi:hypothetical protein
LLVPLARRTRDPFEDFFESFGSRIQRQPVTVTSDSRPIEVRELPPAGRPADYNGAVGQFTIAAKASPTNVAVGDPITLQVEVAGEGNLDSLTFPGNSEWSEFKLYAPSSKTSTTDGLGLAGVKSFERVVIPQTADIGEVPAIAFSFFDPERNQYRTLRTAPIPLHVRPSTAVTPQPTVMAAHDPEGTDAPLARDIVHVKPFLGTVQALQPPLVQQPWFLALQALPIVAWLSALLGRKYRERLENNPRRRRRLAVAETVRRGLKQLRQHAEDRQSELFFATLFRLLQEQLGERLDLPASAITEAVLEERLQGRAPDELLSSLHQMFQTCNQARYAPQHTGEELISLLPRIEQALRDLRQLPDPRDEENRGPGEGWPLTTSAPKQ